MKIEIVVGVSKKGNTYYALAMNGVYLTFDVNVIARACNMTVRDVYLLERTITIQERG